MRGDDCLRGRDQHANDPDASRHESAVSGDSADASTNSGAGSYASTDSGAGTDDAVGD